MASTRFSLRNAENTNAANPKGLLANKTGVTTRSALGDIGNKAKLDQRALKGNQEVSKQPSKPVRNLTRHRATTTLQLQNNKVEKWPKKAESEVKEVSKSQNVSLMDIVESENEIKDVVMEEVPAFGGLHLADVEDIDAEDRDNPQLAVEYVNEIYAYMRQLEKTQPIAESYFDLFKDRVAIKPKMRNLLVDWLVDVHQQFNLLQETLFLTVFILDRFLMLKADALSTKKLQLVGVTAMLIASKYEEMYPPELGDFVYITDSAYTGTEIRQMEIKMISTLNFDLGRPLPLNFLRRNSKAGFVDSYTHGLAKYVMELSLVDYRVVHISPSILAAASLAVAMKVLDTEETSLSSLWTPTLRYYTAYTIDELRSTISLLAKVVLTAHGLDESGVSSGKKLQAVTKKYSTKKFLKISLLPCLNSDAGNLKDLKEN